MIDILQFCVLILALSNTVTKFRVILGVRLVAFPFFLGLVHPFIFIVFKVKLSKLQKKSSKTMFSYSFSNIMQCRLHISAPNFQTRIQRILAHLLTPLSPLEGGGGGRASIVEIQEV